MQPHTASTPTQSQTPVQAPALRVKTHVKAGGWPVSNNHNETLVRVPRPATGLKGKTHLKAGGVIIHE